MVERVKFPTGRRVPIDPNGWMVMENMTEEMREYVAATDYDALASLVRDYLQCYERGQRAQWQEPHTGYWSDSLAHYRHDMKKFLATPDSASPAYVGHGKVEPVSDPAVLGWCSHCRDMVYRGQEHVCSIPVTVSEVPK
jgi:hypothetical protein